jgi:hypothetical protein
MTETVAVANSPTESLGRELEEWSFTSDTA